MKPQKIRCSWGFVTMPPTSGSRFTNQATGRNRVDRKFLGTRKCGFQIGAEERNGRNWVALECSLLFSDGRSLIEARG